MSEPFLVPLAPLPPAVWTRRRARPLPFPLEEATCRLFARARHGLWQGVRAAGLQPGDEVLAPAYHHGSEIEAFVQAGLTCRFYEATATLEPDEDELSALVGARTRALHLVHYLGFPQDAGRWRRWCDERGLLLIEDAAQAWLAEAGGRPLGSDGDLAVFCLYKTFGLPDGGALVSRAPLEVPTGRGRSGAFDLGLEHAMWLATRSARIASVAERFRRRRPHDPQHDFALGNPASPPCRGTLLALPRIADPGVAAIRRSNYARLLAELGDLVVPAFALLPPGASPFVFPVALDDKSTVLARLRSRRIMALNFWSVPHPSLPAASLPGAAALRARVVGLPVHQELREGDLDRVVESVKAASSR